MGEQRSWQKMNPFYRLALSALFITLLGVVGLGGFAWPLAKPQLSTWPWNQSWFMFYKSSGNHYYLQLKGQLEDGSPSTVAFPDYFKYRSAFHSPRFNEVGRELYLVRQLAGYVCRKYNATAPAGGRLARVTVWDSWWPDQRGMRRTVDQVAPDQLKTYTYVDNETCERLELETNT